MPKKRPPVVIDEITELDKLWFKQNPRVRERTRPPYPREVEAYGNTDMGIYNDSAWGILRYPVISGLKED